MTSRPKPKLDPATTLEVLCLLQGACADMASRAEMYNDHLRDVLTEAAQLLRAAGAKGRARRVVAVVDFDADELEAIGNPRLGRRQIAKQGTDAILGRIVGEGDGEPQRL